MVAAADGQWAPSAAGEVDVVLARAFRDERAEGQGRLPDVEAERYFSSLDAEFKNHNDAKFLYLELLAARDDSNAIVKFSYDLLKDGLKSPRIYRLAIDHSRKIGRSDVALKPVLERARADFPKETFE